MKKTGEDRRLYEELKKLLLTERLQNISRELIDSYRSGRNGQLRRYADSAFEGSGHTELPPNKLFLKLIKFYHPDRIEGLVLETERAFQNGDTASLESYHRALSVESNFGAGTSRRVFHTRTADSEESRTGRAADFSEKYDYHFEEEYRFDEEDFGYRTGTFFEEDYYDTEDDREAGGFFSSDMEFDFFSAVKAELFGNLDIHPGPGDLASLEGELDLSGYGICELDGAEFCRNISRLNLSGNRIDNLYPLRGLIYLRELFLASNHIYTLDDIAGLGNLGILDISDNDVEELTPLLGMENLKFIDVRGNPLRRPEEIKRLEAEGVVVLY